MHYYQFNIGDYKSHTEHLSELEDLAYRRMLDLYYLHEKPLPADIEQIARLIRMRTHCDCIADVLREFFECTESGWVNHRAETELQRIGTKSEKARESAKARWLKTKEKPVNANAMRTHSECNATQDTIHITHNTDSKETTSPKGRSTRLPNDWELPDEWAIWTKENRPELNPNQVADSFKDYWIAVAGVKGKKQDWFATWRNWVRNQRATNKHSEPPWEREKREWYEQATGKSKPYEKDIFDLALEEQRLRIAK
jgi:uncharacterized protein YdaU (DUF1376 family)